LFDTIDMSWLHGFYGRTGVLSFFIQSFIALFVIVDPIGNVPVFLGVLERFTEAERKAVLRKAFIVAGTALFIVTLTGNIFFKILGIELYSFRIAGGLLLSIVSIEMLYGRKTRTESSSDEERHYSERDAVSIIPLAIPLLTGPGALTTGIVLFETAGNYVNRIVLLGVIIIVYFIAYFILAESAAVFRYMGKTGTTVATRIMGLMLLSMAVQFVVGGIQSAFPQISE
jgi:multiple antibiotic resistance protein